MTATEIINMINGALTTTFLFLLVGVVTFGLLALAMILGAKHGAPRRGRVATIREQVRFSSTSRWYLSALSDKMQYIIIGAAALVVALLVVVVGGVFGFVFGGVVLLLFAGLRYWFAL